jgi:hypothetical protein
VILLTYTRANPRTVVVELPHASPAKVAMLRSIFDSTVAEIAKIILGLLEAEQLILLECAGLEPWISASTQHEVGIGDEQCDEGKKVDVLMFEEVIVFVEYKQDEYLDHEIDEEASEGVGFALEL